MLEMLVFLEMWISEFNPSAVVMGSGDTQIVFQGSGFSKEYQTNLQSGFSSSVTGGDYLPVDVANDGKAMVTIPARYLTPVGVEQITQSPNGNYRVFLYLTYRYYEGTAIRVSESNVVWLEVIPPSMLRMYLPVVMR
jgi:hypothetical protein